MSILQLVLEYMKVLAWPLLITGVLIAYRPPLRRLFESFVSKLEAAASVTIGSFSIEVQQQARDLGSPELGREIGKLSFNAIEALVRTPRKGKMIMVSVNNSLSPREYGIPFTAELDGLRELNERKLISFSEPLDQFVSLVTQKGRLMEKDLSKRDSSWDWYATDDPEVEKRSREFGYELTEAGRKAIEAISRAVASQLSRQAS